MVSIKVLKSQVQKLTKIIQTHKRDSSFELDSLFFDFLKKEFPFIFYESIMMDKNHLATVQQLLAIQVEESLSKQYYKQFHTVLQNLRERPYYAYICALIMIYFKRSQRDSLYSLFSCLVQGYGFINPKWQYEYQRLIINLLVQKDFKKIEKVYRQNISINMSLSQLLIYILILGINQQQGEAIQILKTILNNKCEVKLLQLKGYKQKNLKNQLQIIIYLISTRQFCSQLFSPILQQNQYFQIISMLFKQLALVKDNYILKIGFCVLILQFYGVDHKKQFCNIFIAQQNCNQAIFKLILDNYRADDQFSQTKKILQHARKLYPKQSTFIEQQMKLSYNMRFFKSTISCNQQLIEYNPKNAYGFYYAGLASFAELQIQRCIYYFEQSLLINKDNIYARKGLGQLNLMFKNYLKSIQYLTIQKCNFNSHQKDEQINHLYFYKMYVMEQLSKEQALIYFIRNQHLSKIFQTQDCFFQAIQQKKAKRQVSEISKKNASCPRIITQKKPFNRIYKIKDSDKDGQTQYLQLGEFAFQDRNFQVALKYYEMYLKLYSNHTKMFEQFFYLAQISQTLRLKCNQIIGNLKNSSNQKMLLNLFIVCYYKYIGNFQYQALCVKQFNDLVNECYSDKTQLKYYFITDRFIQSYQILNHLFDDLFIFQLIFVLHLRQYHKKFDKAILKLYNKYSFPQLKREQVFMRVYQKQLHYLTNQDLKEIYSQLFPFFMNQEQFIRFQQLYNKKYPNNGTIQRLSILKSNRLKRNYQQIIYICRRFQNIIDKIEITEEGEQSLFRQQPQFTYMNQNLKRYKLLQSSIKKIKMNRQQKQFISSLLKYLNKLKKKKDIKKTHSQYFFILTQLEKPQFNIQSFPLLKDYQKVTRLLDNQRDQVLSTIFKYIKQYIEQDDSIILKNKQSANFIPTPQDLLLQRISIYLRAFIRQRYFKYLLINFIINKIDYNCSKNQIQELSSFSQYLITFYLDKNLTMFDISHKISQFSKQKTQTYYSKESAMDIPELIEYSQIKNHEQTASLKTYLQQQLTQYKKTVKDCSHCCLNFLTSSNYQPVQMKQLKNHYNIQQILTFFISVADMLFQLLQQKIFVIDFSFSNIVHNNLDSYKLKLNNNSIICYNKSKEHRCLGLLKQIIHALKKAKLKNIHLQIDNFNPFLSYLQSFVCDMVKQMKQSQEQSIKTQINLNKFEERLKKIYIDSYVQIVQEIVKHKQKNVNSLSQKKKYQQILHRNKLLKIGTISFDKIKNLRISAKEDSSDQTNSIFVKGCADDQSSLSVQSLTKVVQKIITIGYKLQNVKFNYKGYHNFKKRLFRNHYWLLHFLTSHRELINVALYNLNQGWSDYILNREFFEYQMEKRLKQIPKTLPTKQKIDLQLLIKQKLKMQSSRNKQDQNILAYLLIQGKFEILSFMKDIANGILELQRLGIYHGDLIFRNTIKTNKYKFIDFDRAFKLTWESPYKKSIQCFNNTLSLIKNWIQYFLDKDSRIKSNKKGLRSLQILEFIFRDHPKLGEIEQQLFKMNSQQQILQFFIAKLKQYAQQHHLRQFRILTQCLMCTQLIGQETYFTKEQFDRVDNILQELFENGNYESFRQKLDHFFGC